MVNYTVLEFETEVIKEAERLNLAERFNKKMSYSDCADVILLMDSETRNRQQLNKLCINHLNKIKSKFSFKGLRIWFYAITHNSILDSNNPLVYKYDKLIDDIIAYHHELIKDEFNTALEYYIYQSEIKKAYNTEFGIIKDNSNSLWAILKVIKDSYYDENIIKALLNQLKNMLQIYGDKYYITKDLTDKNNLKELYLHLGEENLLDTDCINNNKLFYTDDGYGNSYLSIDGCYQPSTIENFKRW